MERQWYSLSSAGTSPRSHPPSILPGLLDSGSTSACGSYHLLRRIPTNVSFPSHCTRIRIRTSTAARSTPARSSSTYVGEVSGSCKKSRDWDPCAHCVARSTPEPWLLAHGSTAARWQWRFQMPTPTSTTHYLYRAEVFCCYEWYDRILPLFSSSPHSFYVSRCSSSGNGMTVFSFFFFLLCVFL